VSAFVSILTFLLGIAAVVMLAVAVVSACNAVRLGAWRALLSRHQGWFRAPPGVDPAFWRHGRRFWMCFVGYFACGIVMQAMMLVRRSM
jgi:hypothetical protein